MVERNGPDRDASALTGSPTVLPTPSSSRQTSPIRRSMRRSRGTGRTAGRVRPTSSRGDGRTTPSSRRRTPRSIAGSRTVGSTPRTTVWIATSSRGARTTPRSAGGETGRAPDLHLSGSLRRSQRARGGPVRPRRRGRRCRDDLPADDPSCRSRCWPVPGSVHPQRRLRRSLRGCARDADGRRGQRVSHHLRRLLPAGRRLQPEEQGRQRSHRPRAGRAERSSSTGSATTSHTSSETASGTTTSFATGSRAKRSSRSRATRRTCCS